MGTIDLNMDLSKPVLIEAAVLDWTPSPMPGVDRRRLEREEAETGRATSIVRYAPGSSFSAHVHGGGEEYLVLDGVFSDEAGDFGRGCYVRNPPGSRHAPSSPEGCVIFVKLCQMKPGDEPQVVVDTERQPWLDGAGDGWSVMPLFENERERVRLNRLDAGSAPGARVYPGGLEILVLKGKMQINGTSCAKETWGRFPPGSEVNLASSEGAVFWSKEGHLDMTQE